jgi:3-oxoacyl-[acyl-carrier-protein] synthase III
MKIVGVEHAVPTLRIDAAWIIDKLRRENASTWTEEDLGLLEEQVVSFLKSAGSDVKYQVSGEEKAVDFAVAAVRGVLETSGTRPKDVEFLIYAGVGRGWLEPATANVIQSQAGLGGATCFDLLDGCAGWLRSLQVAHSLIRSGAYRRGLIVDCECGFSSLGQWRFESLKDLQRYLATYTIGEAATATLLSDDNPDDDFYFKFANFGEHSDLCMIPLAHYRQFLPHPPDRAYLPQKFFAESKELLSVTTRKLVDLFLSNSRLMSERHQICFGHSASEKASELVRKQLKIPSAVYYRTHARYGNTVSASVPLGMSLAIREGRLSRGEKVLVIVAASGITVGLASFTF